MTSDNNVNILVGSTVKALDRRIILGGPVTTVMIALFNTIVKLRNYSNFQLDNGNEEYLDTIIKLDDLLLKIKYGCPDICNYYKQIESTVLIDFKASNATITIDTVDLKISQLQITT